MGLNIVAEEVDNESNKADAEIKIEGPCPAVVCFYRSQKQREGGYGTDESPDLIPPFGFDVYIPKLYGDHEEVIKSYHNGKPHSDIITGYTANIKSKKTTEKRNIRLYPHLKEWDKKKLEEIVADEKNYKNGEKDFPKNGERNYFPAWMNPVLYTQGRNQEAIQQDMVLHVNILFPKDKDISSDDDFLKYKNSSTTEDIFFKLVKVDENWNPIRVTEWDKNKKKRTYKYNEYVEISNEEPIDENEKKDLEDSINAKDREVQEEKEKESIAKEEYDKADAEKTKAETPMSVDEVNSASSEKRDEIQVRHKKAQEDIINRYHEERKHTTEYQIKSLNKEEAAELKSTKEKYQNEYDLEHKKLEDKREKSIEKNRHPDYYDEEKYNNVIEKQKKRLEEKNEITTKRKDLEKELNVLKKRYDTNFYNPTDNTLNIINARGGEFTFPFTFKPQNDKNGYTDITIRRTGSNLRAALIAYYKRPDKKNNVDKQYIIGQVNILAAEFYKEFTIYQDDYLRSFDMPLYFQPMPVHFVKILLKELPKDPQKKPEVKDWQLHKYTGSPDLSDFVRDINRYFNQAGIKFRNTGTASEMEVVIEKGFQKKLLIGNDEFLINDDGTVNTKGEKDSKIDDEIKNIYHKFIVNNFLYDNTGEEVTKAIAISKNCPELTKKYNQLFKDYPQLCPKDSNKETYKKNIFKLTNSISNYLVNNIFLVFLLKDVNGGHDQESGTTGEFAAAYTYPNSNRIFVFGSAINKRESFLSTTMHELGHSLTLQHTFSSARPMFPQNVTFDDDWHKKCNEKEPVVNGSELRPDYKGYGATYDCIMDYGKSSGSKNNSFIRRSFTKFEWDKMNEAIVTRCKQTSEKLGDKDNSVFEFLKEEKLDDSERIVQNNQGTNNMEFVSTEFIQDILNLIN